MIPHALECQLGGFDRRMDCKAEEERAQRVSLVDATLALDFVHATKQGGRHT